MNLRGPGLLQKLLASRRLIVLTARIFRLFVCFTFSNFIAEREALQKVVFSVGITHKCDFLEILSHHNLMCPYAL